MKKIISSIALIAFSITASLQISANPINDIEKYTQKQVLSELQKKGYNAEVDNRDNSINFNSGDDFYYIIAKGNGSGIMFTLYGKSIRFDQLYANEEEKNRKMDIAGIAADMMNADFSAKTYVANDRMFFTFPYFAKDSESFINVLTTLMKNIKEVRIKHADYMKKAEKYFESKYSNDIVDDSKNNNNSQSNNKIILPQPEIQVTEIEEGGLLMSDVAFRNVKSDFSQLTGYANNPRKSDLQFIQPKVTLSAIKKGNYRLGVKIISPDGKVLVPSDNSEMTIINYIEVDKKPKEYELGIFGTDKKNFWQVGEYTVTFYDNNREIKTTSFTVL